MKNASRFSAPSVALSVALSAVITTFSPGLRAEEPRPAPPAAPVVTTAPAPTETPRLHVLPRATAIAGRDHVLEAVVEHPELIKRAYLVVLADDGAREIPFQRAASGPYVAVIPGDRVRAPRLAYAIEIETVAGERLPIFASRDTPHEVQVREPIEDVRERALLARLDGRRSVVSAFGEYAAFGQTDTVTAPGTKGASVADRYWRAEASYTYRMLGTVSEFGLRLGLVRGRSAVPGQTDASSPDVGLNYGAPTVRVRVRDWLHVEAEMLTSVTEVGFSVGGGGAVLLGDPYGAKLTLGAESIQIFGTRGYTRLDLPLTPRITVAPTVEITDMPHASKTGVRLFADARFDVAPGWQVTGRLGYQSRDAASGGPGFGAGVAYAF